jgi:hypothetical protein
MLANHTKLEKVQESQFIEHSMAVFLAKVGNRIEQIPMGKSSDQSGWPVSTKAEIEHELEE